MTYVWLAEGIEEGTGITGKYFFQSEEDSNASDVE